MKQKTARRLAAEVELEKVKREGELWRRAFLALERHEAMYIATATWEGEQYRYWIAEWNHPAGPILLERFRVRTTGQTDGWTIYDMERELGIGGVFDEARKSNCRWWQICGRAVMECAQKVRELRKEGATG